MDALGVYGGPMASTAAPCIPARGPAAALPTSVPAPPHVCVAPSAGFLVEPVQRFEHRLRPLSAGVAVPVFALLSAGVAVDGIAGLRDALSDRAAMGIVAGLVIGKAVGITGSAALVSRFTRAELDADLSWSDVLGLSLLAGVGLTVSLLIGELAFGTGSERDEHVKVGVLVGSLLGIALATVVLRVRDGTYRLMERASA